MMDDLISRRAVIDRLASVAKVMAKSDARKSMMGRCIFFVEKLPPVIPAEKIGRWAILKDEYGDIVEATCSNCKENGNHEWAYCPHCGAKMRE